MRIEEIAALAGVSRSTVSRAINNEPRVSPETRQRIEGIIREQGYHPNVVARSLRRRRAQTIGIVIHHTMSDSVTSPYHAIIMRAVTDLCEERSYNLMLSPAARLSPDRYADIIENGAVDGLIVTTPLVGRPFLAWLHKTGFPFVLIGRQDDLPGISRVCADDEQGGMLAAHHLLQLGYRRLALLTGPRNHDGASARMRGFIDAVRAAGLGIDTSNIIESGFTISSGESGMHQLLALGTQPEAVFCCCDDCAIGAVHVLRSAGLRVPDDMAVIGFDDTPISATVDPPLTTVRQPIEQMGRQAASLLLDNIDARQSGAKPEGQPQVIKLPTQLVSRASCATKLASGRSTAAAEQDVAAS